MSVENINEAENINKAENINEAKNINISHLHLKVTMCVSSNMHQLKIYASITCNWSRFDLVTFLPILRAGSKRLGSRFLAQMWALDGCLGGRATVGYK